MDTSEQYIKMCEKAEEIQKEWQGLLKTESNHLLPWADSGDFVYCKSNNKIVVLYFNKYHGSPPEKYLSPYTAIWLPRQDQLQEILGWTNLTVLLAELLDFSSFPESYEKHPDPQIDIQVYRWDSMEQLWLAFVMHELHQKKWNGTEWVASC